MVAGGGTEDHQDKDQDHLGGEQERSQVDKEDMGGRGGVARPQDGDDVGDAQQGDDHLAHSRIFSLPMTVMVT